jgi:GNAT superfamily N-acetyltransferase
VKEIALAPADQGDRQEILDLLHAQLSEHGARVSIARLARAIDAVLDDPALGFFHVARTRAGVVGVAYVATIWSLEHGGRSAWLDELYVEPEYRLQGVGAELLHAAMERARRMGCAAMDLEVDADHARAEHLYTRAGYRRLPRARWVRALDQPEPA